MYCLRIHKYEIKLFSKASDDKHLIANGCTTFGER